MAKTPISKATRKRIYNTFLKNGFSKDEALWAADNNLDPRGGPQVKQIRRLLSNRLTRLKIVMREFKWDRDFAVSKLEDVRVKRAMEVGAEDTDNVFIGESP